MKNSNILAFILICVSILSVFGCYYVVHRSTKKVDNATIRVGDVHFTATDERVYRERHKRSSGSVRYDYHHIVTFVSDDGAYTFEKDYKNNSSFGAALSTVTETRTVFNSLSNEYVVGGKSNMTHDDLKKENSEHNRLTMLIFAIVGLASGGYGIKIFVSNH